MNTFQLYTLCFCACCCDRPRRTIAQRRDCSCKVRLFRLAEQLQETAQVLERISRALKVLDSLEAVEP